MSTSRNTAVEKIVVSLKHNTAPWTVIHASDTEDLFDIALDLFPNEVGPALQKKNPDASWIIAIMQNAYTAKQDAAIEHFAKNVVKEKLGGREVDEDDDPRESRRYGNTDRDDRYGSRRSRDDEDPETDSRPRRRYNGDDDEDERPARRSRSYGDGAEDPRAEHEYCKHGDRSFVEKPNFTAMFCGADRDTPESQKCKPYFFNKKWKKWSQPKD